MRIFGILCDNHHHEVATAGQCEIDINYDKMTNAADSGPILQICHTKTLLRNMGKLPP